MAKRRLPLNTDDRDTFLAALRTCRDACVDVCRTSAIDGEAYKVAGKMIEAIDDAALGLIGDRQHFWLEPHSNSGVAKRREG